MNKLDDVEVVVDVFAKLLTNNEDGVSQEIRPLLPDEAAREEARLLLLKF